MAHPTFESVFYSLYEIRLTDKPGLTATFDNTVFTPNQSLEHRLYI